MIVALGLVTMTAFLSAPGACSDTPRTEPVTAREAPRASDRSFGVLPLATLRRFERSGWKRSEVFGLDDLAPPMHVSVAEMGPDTSGWVSRRGRRDRWQLDAWQVTALSRVELETDSHVHWSYRVPLRRRHERR